jgi:hypothetical protein
MRTASSSQAQSAARYRALHRTAGSSLSGCSRYQEPLQELRSIACVTKRPISAARRREGGWQALQVGTLRCAIELGRHPGCLSLALLGPREMSDLSPQADIEQVAVADARDGSVGRGRNGVAAGRFLFLSGLIIESASGRFAEIGRSEQSYTDADARSAHTQSDTFAATTRS